MKEITMQFTSYQAMADYLGIPKRTIENWFYRGIPETPYKLLQKIAKLEAENKKLKQRLDEYALMNQHL